AKASLIYKGICNFIQNYSPVYEDDLDRNYYLILEVLIALRQFFERGDGLPTVKDLQDWGNDQAQKLRSMLGHLHALARKADAARNPKVHVLKTLYLKMVGKKEDALTQLVVDLDEEPIWVEDKTADNGPIAIKDPPAEEAEPSSELCTDIAKTFPDSQPRSKEVAWGLTPPRGGSVDNLETLPWNPESHEPGAERDMETGHDKDGDEVADLAAQQAALRKEKREVEKPTKTKKDKKAPADGNGKEDEKEKRRAKAKEGWLKLQEVEVPGLVMPKELNGRISFTMKSPDGQGSSVGVILNAVDNKQGVTVPWQGRPEVAWGHATCIAGWGYFKFQQIASLCGNRGFESGGFISQISLEKLLKEIKPETLGFLVRQGVDYETDGCCHDLLGNIGFMFAVRQILRIKEGGLGYWADGAPPLDLLGIVNGGFKELPDLCDWNHGDFSSLLQLVSFASRNGGYQSDPDVPLQIAPSAAAFEKLRANLEVILPSNICPLWPQGDLVLGLLRPRAVLGQVKGPSAASGLAGGGGVKVEAPPAVHGGDEKPADASVNGSPSPSDPTVDGQKPLRHLETQTTIPLGHVDDMEVDAAMDEQYNKPLWRCLFESLPGREVALDKLVKPTCIWLDIRQENGDVSKVDPTMQELCFKAVTIKELIHQKETAVKTKEREHNLALAKINSAVDAMTAQQRQKVEAMGSTNVEESPLFQVNKKNIMVWKGNKVQVLEKAFQCVMDEFHRAEDLLHKHVEKMIENAYSSWAEHMHMEPDVGIDPDLFGELEAIMETSPKVSMPVPAAEADLGQHLDDHRQVCDVTQATASVEPGEVTGDRVESQEDYDRRMAVNAKMSSRCPTAVLEKAKGRRHNRQLIGELFEAWLSAGEDWLQSSIVCNASRSMAQRRRGKYTMMTYRTLKERFGNSLAKQILHEKKKQEEDKVAGDPLVYWMKHPDVDHEDEVSEDLTIGITASGGLDQSQTRQAMRFACSIPIMQIAVGGDLERFQAAGLGLQPGAGGTPAGAPAPRAEKVKKVVPLAKQVTNKISSSATLLTGFKTELDARKTAICAAKTSLESCYAQTLGKTDETIHADQKLLETINTNLANCESAFTSFNGTIKSIKLAIDPPAKKEPRPKAKAKADSYRKAHEIVNHVRKEMSCGYETLCAYLKPARVCVAWMASFLDDLCRDEQYQNLVVMKDCMCSMAAFHLTLEENGRYLTLEAASLLQQQCDVQKILARDWPKCGQLEPL
ncbi:unnamed protein product, partial [Cladocopium goreaui]